MIERNKKLIHHFLEHSSRDYPDKVAVIYEDVRATYRDIDTSANQLSRWILNQKVRKGDRVALVMENCIEYIISYYAVLKAGLVVAPLSFELKPDGLCSLLKDLKPSIVIASTRCERVLRAANIIGTGVKTIVITRPKLDWRSSGLAVYSWEDVASGKTDQQPPSVEIQSTDLASIIYTSGSTGKSKGVILSHQNIFSNTKSICQYLRLNNNDIQMVVLPFFYVMGKSLLNTHFAVGGTVVINNKFAFPATVIKQMKKEKVTGFSGVPSTYAYLLHRSPLAASRDKLVRLRYCSQAGGHMAMHLKKELREALPDSTKIYIMYGATEASARLTYLPPENFEQKMGSIGKAIPGVTLRVLDNNGNEVTHGKTGELVAKGDNIMVGYWNDGSATEKVLDDKGYHTGDLGYKDEEGFYYVISRKDNLLKVGGHRINPQEIEDVIMGSGLVIEVAVVGMPDALLGQKMIAVVAPKDERLDKNTLKAICDGRLPKYKKPTEIRLMKMLPKNINGKINQNQIIEDLLV